MNTFIGLVVFILAAVVIIAALAWRFASQNEDKQKLEDSAFRIEPEEGL